jgi:hypothetical protein
MNKQTCVYWLRLEKHKDINQEGYVGVALDFDTRMQRHLQVTAKLDCHLGRAIRLYGWLNITKEVVFEGTPEECYAYEHSLRPRFQIGWNEAIGGCGGDRSEYIDYVARGKPVGNKNPKYGESNPFWGKSHTVETLQKNSHAHAKSLIKTPQGNFYGFSALGKFLGVHKATAKKIAIKEGWKIESQP